MASKSPRRQELLERIGIKNFRVIPADVDEKIESGAAPERAVCRISRAKATAVAPLVKNGEIIIAADTLVCIDGRILGKPENAEAAVEMIGLLSGRRHEVYSGVTVLRDSRALTEYEVTSVWFRELDKSEITAYVATGEPMDKAGAYGVQGLGSAIVGRIEGDFYNVMGLPLARLVVMLRQFGVDVFSLAQRSSAR